MEQLNHPKALPGTDPAIWQRYHQAEVEPGQQVPRAVKQVLLPPKSLLPSSFPFASFLGQ
jgi:hypothetical protein